MKKQCYVCKKMAELDYEDGEIRHFTCPHCLSDWTEPKELEE